MKKFFISAAVVAAAVCGAFTANQVNNEVAMSDLQKENLDALAINIEVEVGVTCAEVNDDVCDTADDGWRRFGARL